MVMFVVGVLVMDVNGIVCFMVFIEFGVSSGLFVV